VLTNKYLFNQKKKKKLFGPKNNPFGIWPIK